MENTVLISLEEWKRLDELDKARKDSLIFIREFKTQNGYFLTTDEALTKMQKTLVENTLVNDKLEGENYFLTSENEELKEEKQNLIEKFETLENLYKNVVKGFVLSFFGLLIILSFLCR